MSDCLQWKQSDTYKPYSNFTYVDSIVDTNNVCRLHEQFYSWYLKIVKKIVRL